MPIRHAQAHWSGGLKKGEGEMKLESGVIEGAYTLGTRFEYQPGTNPEELIGAAHAACFSMALAMLLEEAGHPPEDIDTQAQVHLEAQNADHRIARIVLSTQARVSGIDEADFARQAEAAKTNCPVSRALGGVEISLKAQLM